MLEVLVNDQSIRRFALKYYRQSGAMVRSLDDHGDTFEVKTPDGTPLTVNFGCDNQEPQHALTATSPQWRSIIDDLTGDVTVSYRYLTAGPIAHHVQTLSALMPTDWTLIDAKLNRVENRQALGYSHRITFDSPALNARREMMQHHLWDVRLAKRFVALEPIFYQTPYIMLKPEQQIAEAVVQHFLTRSLDLVDQATDARGLEIEAELQDLGQEANHRITEYFAQQRRTLTTRLEVLQDKLAGLALALEQTVHPQQRARLLEEHQQLGAHVEGLRAQTTEKMLKINEALAEKLEQERARHELTAVTDLAAICHVAYDRLWYDATVQAPDGTHYPWELSFCPVARELTLPPCARCQAPLKHPVPLAGGRFACADCVSGCKICGAASVATAAAASACHTCDQETCEACAIACGQCQQTACQNHVQLCGGCQKPVCATCQAACETCGVALCFAHAKLDHETGQLACPTHVTHAVKRGRDVGGQHAFTDTPTASAVSPAVPAALQAIPSGQQPGAVAEDSALVTQEAAPVVKPSASVTCCACHTVMATGASTGCVNCGLHACSACAVQGPVPCPACDGLRPITARDGRLGFVFERFPHLAKRKRHWQIAQLGHIVLCQWSCAGRWGQVLYHAPDGVPVLLNSFECGVLETLLQAIVGFWRD